MAVRDGSIAMRSRGTTSRSRVVVAALLGSSAGSLGRARLLGQGRSRVVVMSGAAGDMRGSSFSFSSSLNLSLVASSVRLGSLVVVAAGSSSNLVVLGRGSTGRPGVLVVILAPGGGGGFESSSVSIDGNVGNVGNVSGKIDVDGSVVLDVVGKDGVGQRGGSEGNGSRTHLELGEER
jgi:hypothetical protein